MGSVREVHRDSTVEAHGQLAWTPATFLLPDVELVAMSEEKGPFRWSEEDLAEVRASYRGEVSSRWVHESLAARDPLSDRSKMFRTLTGYGEKHAAL